MEIYYFNPYWSFMLTLSFPVIGFCNKSFATFLGSYFLSIYGKIDQTAYQNYMRNLVFYKEQFESIKRPTNGRKHLIGDTDYGKS